MAVYYFDLREGGAFVVDEEGMELRDVEAAQAEAARSLSGIAWDAMRSAGAQAQEMTIEVRDVYGPVMDVKFAFMINRKQVGCFLPARWPSGGAAVAAGAARAAAAPGMRIPAKGRGKRACGNARRNKIAQHDKVRRSSHDVPQCSEVRHDERGSVQYLCIGGWGADPHRARDCSAHSITPAEGGAGRARTRV